jgi:hypothetical protein
LGSDKEFLICICSHVLSLYALVSIFAHSFSTEPGLSLFIHFYSVFVFSVSVITFYINTSMAYSIRNPTALLAIFTALAAAAPQRGGWGGWTGRPQWSRPANTWTQQQPQSTFVTVAGPSPTASSPPIIPSSADGQAPTIIASPSVAQPSNVPAQSVTSQGVPTQGSSSQEGPTVVVPTGTATGAQPSATGSNSGSSSGGSGHCSGESCRPGMSAEKPNCSTDTDRSQVERRQVSPVPMECRCSEIPSRGFTTGHRTLLFPVVMSLQYPCSGVTDITAR